VLDTVLMIAGYISVPLVLLSVFAMVRTIGKPRPLVASGLVLQVILSAAFLVLYRFLLDIGEPTTLSLALLAAGLAGGAFQGFTTKLDVSGDRVMAKRSVFYLVIWGLSFSATQLLAMLGQNTIAAYGLSSVYLATGIAVGMNGTLLARRMMVSASGHPAGIRAVSACPACGSANAPGRKFCGACGRSLATAAAGTACPACGNTASPGQSFCNRCGRSLR
jgi:membrane protein CcdC involved in cytochrome C biogenesis/predicted nucleic acid-binding Zn ribbon protein